ncbi:large conductance mechanosensitive channel protein MscL [Isoptericola sp. NEAU-Y5]|uniref:Large-conductance mechanosensitive channel n=1 Tax=Isoptericola luteus TaxID=2879484 RepID=A0ABS7ZGL5_9MICO|nr:large conductance mechanosensitive channel protein MscL [Isoptericola sp. NEAU-Y5]MCA5892955.1 large conductance mechanosensitive channel protein MscL [Isoptericola sp. NEAU-Y5]
MKSLMSGFKEFVMRGNVVDLAVGIVIGTAFTAVVSGLLDGIINPLIAAIFGQPDISNVMTFPINNAVFSIGLFLNAVLNFLIVAAALYFIVVAPLNHLAERRARGQEEEPEPMDQNVILLQEIRDLLAAQSTGGPGATGYTGGSGLPPRQ